MSERILPATLRACKAAAEPLAALTAYDYPTAVLVDRAGLDVILVGDSLGVMLLGHDRIEATTLDEMIHHCRAVTRGARRALVVGDMPFGTYEGAPGDAVRNAIRLVKEGGVDAVKLEGGTEIVPAIQALTTARIPVFGHLAPAHVSDLAASPEARRAALAGAATAIEAAGACAVVLVGLAPDDAAAVTRALQSIPTLGYRSGPECDGQLLVTPYMLGLLPADAPEPGPYGALGAQLAEIFARFRADVQSGAFGMATRLELTADRAHRES
jgi:3-methyl-2-oxobutanoate hydroxymethyltransferase